MEKLVLHLQQYALGRLIAVLFVVTMAVYLAMLIYAIPSVLELAPDMKILDMLPAGYSHEYAYSLLESIGADGRNIYLTGQIPLDFIYPGLFAITFSLLLIWLFSKSYKANSRIFYFSFVPFAAAAFDYLENIGIIQMLNTFPDTTAELVKMTSTFTILKSSFTVAFYVLLIAGLIPIVKKRFSVNKF